MPEKDNVDLLVYGLYEIPITPRVVAFSLPRIMED